MNTSRFGLFDSDKLGIIFDGPPRSLRNQALAHRSRTDRTAQLLRVIRRTPEVMVRVTGSGKRAGQILEHLRYITRNGKLLAENERGDSVLGLEEVKEVHEEWAIHDHTTQRKRSMTVNIMLSMPEGTAAREVRDAAGEFAHDTFGSNHQYLFVLHTDTPHPHVHLVVKSQGYDRKWLKRSKQDLQIWRETFAQRLREHGIEAEATPRYVRGVVRKGKSQAMYHLERTPERSYVLAAKVDAAIEILTDGARIEGNLPPWEKAIQERQALVRKAFEALSADLMKHQDPDAKAVGRQIAEFRGAMPPIRTERQALLDELREFVRDDRTREDPIYPVGPRFDGGIGRERER